MKIDPRTARIPAALILLAASPGCVQSNVQRASARTPPAVVLGLPGAPASPVAAELETVIVYEGPGSWKRRAFWDEYIVIVTHTGPTPLQLTDATLVGESGAPIKPGNDWEETERQSADWWRRNATAGNLALGAGAIVIGAAAGTSVIAMAAAVLAGSNPILGIAAGVALVSAGAAHLLVVPSEESQRFIADEFDRRRIKFPVKLGSADTFRGSLFFRVTPSPRKLLLHFDSRGPKRIVSIELAPLQGLHRRESPTVVTGATTGQGP
jgi:hypothetical protein